MSRNLAGKWSAIVAAGLGLAAVGANATPVNTVSSDGAGRDLNTLLNTTWYVSGATTDVQNGQYSPDEVFALTSTAGSTNRMIFEFAGYAPSNTFGIYDVTDANCTAATFAQCRKLTIFNGAATSGTGAWLDEMTPGTFTVGSSSATFGSSLFGYFLAGPGGTFFSQSALNEFGTDHLVSYQGQNQTMQWPTIGTRTWGTGDILLGWEDLAATVRGGKPGDWDYNDMLVMVSSVQSVPEPGTLGLLGVALFGVGLASRRRAKAN